MMTNNLLILEELNKYACELEGKFDPECIIKYISKTHECLLSSYEKVDEDVYYFLIRYIGGSDHTVLNKTEEECRSVLLIFRNGKFELIYALFNKIRANESAIKYIRDNKISDENLSYETCYEGTMFSMFYCEYTNKIRIHTRSCMDAHKSYWNKNHSYGTLIERSLKKNNIKISDFLDKKYYYIMVLVDHNNFNIVSYEKEFGKNYSKILFVAKRKIGSMFDEKFNEKDIKSAGFVISPKHNFRTFDDALKYIEKKNTDMKESNTIEEGLIVKIGDGKIVMKLQTEKYININSIKPNVYNNWIMYMILYQKQKLREYINFYPDINPKVIKIINSSFNTIKQEIYNLYHATRNKKCPELYNVLPSAYKKIMYDIHGVYKQKQTIITLQDIDEYLRKIDDGHSIYNLFLARCSLSKINCVYINQTCRDLNYLIKELIDH